MYHGHGTIGGVALRIIEDFHGHGSRSRRDPERQADLPKRLNRHTMHQFIEEVVWRRRSVVSCEDYIPSYVWWRVGVDKWGEITPIIDFGRLADVPMRRGRKRVERRRYIWPREVAEESGPWDVVNGVEVRGAEAVCHSDSVAQMLYHGLSFGQDVLSRMEGWWWNSSYECNEWDREFLSEIIYVEPVTFVDIPVQIEIPKPKMTKLTVL